jgi:hypothetical protein
MKPWYDLPMIVGVVMVVLILGIAALVLWKMFTGKIPLDFLIAEPGSEGNKASLSRFQFLVFTFVVAGLFLLLSIESGTFVEIPTSVLGLLGISGGSYVLAKGITANAEVKKTEADAGVRTAEAYAGRSRRPGHMHRALQGYRPALSPLGGRPGRSVGRGLPRGLRSVVQQEDPEPRLGYRATDQGPAERPRPAEGQLQT